MQISDGVSGSSATIAGYIGYYDKAIARSMERLASGLRVVRPSDDVSSYMRGQALTQRAAQTDTLSGELGTHQERVKSAQDYLGSIQTMIEEMANLAKEASTEESSTIRETLGKEFDNKYSAMQDFVSSARYNGDQLLKGAYDDAVSGALSGFSVQIGEESSDTYRYQFLDTRVESSTGLNMATLVSAQARFKDGSTNPLTLADFDGDGSSATGKDYAAYYYDQLTEQDAGLARIKRNLLRTGTHTTVLEAASTTLANTSANYKAATSALVGVNDAEETTRLSAMRIRQQAAASFLAQSHLSFSGVVTTLTNASAASMR